MGVGYPDEIEQYARHGRGYDGLRAAHTRSAARPALYQRRPVNIKNKAMPKTRRRPTPPATAWCAAAIRGLICAT